jgi:hypothetical protein
MLNRSARPDLLKEIDLLLLKEFDTEDKVAQITWNLEKLQGKKKVKAAKVNRRYKEIHTVRNLMMSKSI